MLFEPISEEVVRESIRRLKVDGAQQFAESVNTALDYLAGNQNDDIQSELQTRFPNSMAPADGQEIYPVSIPIVKRYVAEQANAYNSRQNGSPVSRAFVDGDGNETDDTRKLSDQFQRGLEEARYDEVMHRHEQMMVLFDPAPSCLWYQAKRGKLRAVIVLPSSVAPVASDDPQFVDATDPDDYDAFRVELAWQGDDISKVQARTFAYVTAAEVWFYEGTEDSVDRFLTGPFKNPYSWPQVEDIKGTAEEKDLPLQMLTFWHSQQPLDTLLPAPSMSMVNTNREINIILSMLYDDIRFQGRSVPVLKLMNKHDPAAIRKHGSRFPAVLDISEEFTYESAPATYAETMLVLKDHIKLVAMSERMSSNDFSLDGASPASGFAKLVDSLPQIKAREERITRLVHLEEQVAAPRLISVLIALGKLDPRAKDLRLRVRFADVEFPKTETESNARDDFDLKHGLTTAAKILAKREGISEQEAEALVEANREANKVTQPQPEQPQQRGFGLGRRVGRARSATPTADR
jgi:hypothetical protein